jgi:hypothetical protein
VKQEIIEQEAEMRIRNTNTWSRRQVVEAACVALVVSTLFYGLQGMAPQGCGLLGQASWIALEVLRPMVLAAWESMSVYVCQGSGLLQHVLQTVTSIGPLFCVVVGLV